METKEIQVRQMTWLTNFNNKMGCRAMVHIDIKPPVLPSLSNLNNFIFEIVTKDASHPPEKYKLLDLISLPLHQLPDVYAYPSHGISASELVEYYFKTNKNLSFNTEMAVYFYLKLL